MSLNNGFLLACDALVVARNSPPLQFGPWSLWTESPSVIVHPDIELNIVGPYLGAVTFEALSSLLTVSTTLSASGQSHDCAPPFVVKVSQISLPRIRQEPLPGAAMSLDEGLQPLPQCVITWRLPPPTTLLAPSNSPPFVSVIGVCEA